MFSKRKYNRKKGTRRHVRRTSKKNRILRPPPTTTAEKPTFDASGAPVYLWQYVAPNMGRSASSCLKSPLSLRQLCAYHVALNAESLSSEYLQLAPWTCWEFVWKHILAMGKDSPELFRMFAREFSHHHSFWCHQLSFGPLSHIDPDARAQALEWALIPGLRKHRMDNVFSNVSVADLTAFVAKLDCSVVVECSHLDKFTAPQLISIACLPNLVALDLSGNKLVDDQFLYTLRLCLVSKNLNLKILRLSSCESVTKRGIASLLDVDIVSPLCYVESDINMISKSNFALRFLDTPAVSEHQPVPNTKWKLLNEAVPSTQQVAHYSLPYKLHYLLRNTDLVGGHLLIWDIKFFPETIDMTNLTSAADSYEASWARRLRSARMKSAYAPYCYLIDPDQVVVPDEKVKPPVVSNLPFSRQGTNAQKPSVRKPKLIRADAKSFFGM